MANKDTSKQWFETGDFPTQDQFAQVFEWLRWKDEALNISDITNLTAILNGLATPVETFVTTGANFEYIIPVTYMMESIVLKPFSNCSPYADIEDSDIPGTYGEMIPNDPDTIIKPSGKSIYVGEPALINQRKIIIYNLPAGSKVILIKRKIA